MFPRQHQNQFRNSNADVQRFYQDGAWTKPAGVSQVYMMLIGGGSPGNSSNPGNSGNVTTWFGNAQNVPDNLVVSPARPVTTFNTVGNSSTISYRGTSLNTLLTAGGGQTGLGANTADAAGTFANSGFYQNVLGQIGVATGDQTASATTFLSGGTLGTSTANYGYFVPFGSAGVFMLQPIIVACSSSALAANNPIGCGGSDQSTTAGAGFILIASW
jgi:hypothetical protein